MTEDDIEIEEEKVSKTWLLTGQPFRMAQNLKDICDNFEDNYQELYARHRREHQELVENTQVDMTAVLKDIGKALDIEDMQITPPFRTWIVDAQYYDDHGLLFLVYNPQIQEPRALDLSQMLNMHAGGQRIN